jgi:putative ABC transport system ATP-binding protein
LNPAAEYVLEAEHISKEYRRGEETFFAVHDVSLALGSGEFVCIMGRSGSGKSTLLNILAGLLLPGSGRILFQGSDYAAMRDRELSRLRNKKIGYIMQGRSILPNLTVKQNVLLPAFLDKNEFDVSGRAVLLLEQVGIPHLAAQYPSRLSGGELRRVAIARALLNDPDLLIADEPASDLDAETAAELMELFASLARKGLSILMVTHDGDAEGLCGRSYTMKSGVLTDLTPCRTGPGQRPERQK